MEKKVKIELPGKYMVGVEVFMPITDKGAIEVCRTFMGTVSEILHGNGDMDFDDLFANGGRKILSNPLIRSIAESKMEGLNNAFEACHVPFRAFIEKEGEP